MSSRKSQSYSRTSTTIGKMIFSSCLIFAAVASVHCAVIPTTESSEVEGLFGDETFNYVRGRWESPGSQCQLVHPLGWSGVCKTDDPATRCAALMCAEVRRTDEPVALNFGPALNGTWCGDKKVCYNGACVDDPKPPKNPLTIDDFEYDCKVVEDMSEYDWFDWSYNATNPARGDRLYQ